MRLAYVISGSTGEYSDRTEWLVKAFLDEQKAREYLLQLQNTYQQFQQIKRGYERPEAERIEMEDTMSKLDSCFHEDYTGTYWHLDWLELIE